jgi:hypothetical protein
MVNAKCNRRRLSEEDLRALREIGGGKLYVFRLTASGGRWCKVRRRLRGGTAAHLRW